MEGLFLIFKFENGRFVLKRIIKCGTVFLLALVLCLCLLPNAWENLYISHPQKNGRPTRLT